MSSEPARRQSNHDVDDDEDVPTAWSNKWLSSVVFVLICVVMIFTVAELAFAIQERGSAHKALRNSREAINEVAQSRHQAEQVSPPVR